MHMRENAEVVPQDDEMPGHAHVRLKIGCGLAVLVADSEPKDHGLLRVDRFPVQKQFGFSRVSERGHGVWRSILYMFPRTDGIPLGGTFERGEWSLSVNETAKARVLKGHAQFFGTFRQCQLAALGFQQRRVLGASQSHLAA